MTMIDRRELLKSAGVVGFVTAAGIVPHLVDVATAATPFDLAPDWRINWVLHKDPKLKAKIEQLPNGVILRAAPYNYTNKKIYDRSNIALWNKTLWTGDFRVEFDFTRLDNVARTTGSGIGAMLYWHVLGRTGDPKHPPSIAAWPSKAADEDAYVRYTRGYRVTWSNFNTRAPQNSNEIRVRTFAFTRNYPTKVGGDSPAVFPFVRDQTYHMAIQRVGQVLTVVVDGHTVTWDDPAIARYNDGYFGIRHQTGRHARYENFTITPP
jgi:hypothetical protein